MVPRPAELSDPGGARTHDLRIKSPLLYQLSYRVGSVLQELSIRETARQQACLPKLAALLVLGMVR